MPLNENISALRIRSLGEYFIRYGLMLVLGWIGAMKFTNYEAQGIQGLVASSPLMSWMYKVFSLQATSNIIGVTESVKPPNVWVRTL